MHFLIPLSLHPGTRVFLSFLFVQLHTLRNTYHAISNRHVPAPWPDSAIHGARWDAATLWQTCIQPTDRPGAVFRSLKPELGLRPICHHKEDRADGHLFITVLAYQAIQILRRKLKLQGVNARWTSLRGPLRCFIPVGNACGHQEIGKLMAKYTDVVPLQYFSISNMLI